MSARTASRLLHVCPPRDGADLTAELDAARPAVTPAAATRPQEKQLVVVMAEPMPGAAAAAFNMPMYAGPMVPLGARLGAAHGLQPTNVAAVDTALASATTGGAVGPLRARKTKRMDRRLTHWQCTFCRHETPMAAQATSCGRCGGERLQLRDADANGREKARRAARCKEYVGRQLNGRGAGTDIVPRAAQGVFERSRVDALVMWETEALEQYTGAASYIRKEECMLGVMESFYIVQTGARMSVMDEEKRAQMTASDVARFFNAVGRRVAPGVAGETTFPMGGYFNEFRREGISVELVLELREVVERAVAES